MRGRLRSSNFGTKEREMNAENLILFMSLCILFGFFFLLSFGVLMAMKLFNAGPDLTVNVKKVCKFLLFATVMSFGAFIYITQSDA